ncbi:MAG TPA: fibronectin type III domain-containing protein [Candidatus Limnocylindria bacterium]
MPGPGRCLLTLASAVLVLSASACVPPIAGPSSFEVGPPSQTPTAEPTDSRPAATAAPTPTSEPTPSPSVDPSLLELEAISCDGGVVLEWSASTDPGFHHYTALRSPEREIEPDYPPIAPAVDWGDTYGTDRFVTSAVDASIIPSETRWFYRVMAYDVENEVVGASPVRGARLGEVDVLGEVVVEEWVGDMTRLEWQAYGGFSRCFSNYRVMFGTVGVPNTVLAVVSGQATDELVTEALHPDTTYVLRIQAVRATTLGSFVVAESEVTTYTPP